MFNALLKGTFYQIYLGLRHDIGPLNNLVIGDRGLSFVDGIALDVNENLTGRLLQGKLCISMSRKYVCALTVPDGAKL